MTVSLEAIDLDDFENSRGPDLGDLEELKASIQEHGLLQALIVREVDPDVFKVRAGFRRYAALEALYGGMEEVFEVPISIIEGEENEDVIINLVENIERQTLPPLRVAAVVAKLREDGWSGTDLAGKFNRSMAWISKQVCIHNKLHPAIKAAVEGGYITLTQALQLKDIPLEEQERLIFEMIEDPHALDDFRDKLDRMKDPRPGLRALRRQIHEILEYDAEMQGHHDDGQVPDSDYRKGIVYALRWVEGVEVDTYFLHPQPPE